MEFDRERLTVSPLGNDYHQAKKTAVRSELGNPLGLRQPRTIPRPICKTPEARTILAFAITAHARALRAASPVHSDKLPRSPHSSRTPNPTDGNQPFPKQKVRFAIGYRPPDVAAQTSSRRPSMDVCYSAARTEASAGPDPPKEIETIAEAGDPHLSRHLQLHSNRIRPIDF
jgi:hypothetical protein